MKLYKVYHNSAFLDHSPFDWGSKIMPDQDKLELVAVVNADTLEDVYQCTNHINKPWNEHPNLTAIGMRFRSTSCGDVIEDTNGHKHVVAANGFIEIKQSEVIGIKQ